MSGGITPVKSSGCVPTSFMYWRGGEVLESLKDVEEGVVKREPCVYCSQLDCIATDIMNDWGGKVESVQIGMSYCMNCLRARLVREIKLLRIVGH